LIPKSSTTKVCEADSISKVLEKTWNRGALDVPGVGKVCYEALLGNPEVGRTAL